MLALCWLENPYLLVEVVRLLGSINKKCILDLILYINNNHFKVLCNKNSNIIKVIYKNFLFINKITFNNEDLYNLLIINKKSPVKGYSPTQPLLVQFGCGFGNGIGIWIGGTIN